MSHACHVTLPLQYHAISQSYYKGLHAIVAVYDVTDAWSFQKMKGWVEEVQESTSKDIPLWIVGNKMDASHLQQVGEPVCLCIMAGQLSSIDVCIPHSCRLCDTLGTFRRGQELLCLTRGVFY